LLRPVAAGPDALAGGRYHTPERVHYWSPVTGGGVGGALVAAPGSTTW
jgi:hypothetical protein